MRYAIFADIHSNLEALNAVLEAYLKEDVDYYFCAGDIVGYGANPQECLERVRDLSIVSVAGNHDWATIDVIDTDSFNNLAVDAISWTKERLTSEAKKYLAALPLIFEHQDLTVVHGTLNSPGKFYFTQQLLKSCYIDRKL